MMTLRSKTASDEKPRESRLLAASVAVLAVVAACSIDDSRERPGDDPPNTRPASALLDSDRAALRLAELRQRFAWTVRTPPAEHLSRRGAREPIEVRAPVIGDGAVESFQPVQGAGQVRALMNEAARRAVSRPATVTLPAHASGSVHVEDVTSLLAIDFALEGARDAELATAGGLALYEGALPEADVIHRVHAEGDEDYVVFEHRPAREELRYSVDVSRVAGLRLVGNVLELLDREGTPRLRVAAPYVVDAAGEQHEAALSVEGCAYDSDPRLPWGRKVTAPGARSCGVRVAWADVGYPAIVDPGWSATGSMATARCNHTSSMLANGKVLVAGGAGLGSLLTSAELYDPATGTWSATAGLKTARRYHTATALANGKALVVGGDGGNANFLTSVELYDPATGTWSATASLSAARESHTATMLANGKVLVAGGDGGWVVLATAEVYDPATGTWSPTGGLAAARTAHAAGRLLNGKVLAAGGNGNNFVQASAEIYDPATGTWSPTGSLTNPRMAHTASVLANGKVLVAGGWGNNTVFGSAELYDPAIGTWSAAGSMSTPREEHTASVLADGKVLVAAGDNGFNQLPSADVYDPAAGTWSAAENLVNARYVHAASVLPNGKVLVSGGFVINPNGVLTSAELYGGTASNGAPCNTPAECLSGFCTGGVCCNTACNTACHACTKAAGAPADGTCATLTGTPCDDGDECTPADTCQAGACVGQNPVMCMAVDQCHVGMCDPMTGMCTNPSKADGTKCDDGNPCTAAAACMAGACTAIQPVTCTPVDECHGAGACDPMTGACSSPAKPDGTSCSGGTCQNGTCESGTSSSTGTGGSSTGTGGSSTTGTGGAGAGGSTGTGGAGAGGSNTGTGGIGAGGSNTGTGGNTTSTSGTGTGGGSTGSTSSTTGSTDGYAVSGCSCTTAPGSTPSLPLDLSILAGLPLIPCLRRLRRNPERLRRQQGHA